MVVRPRPRCVAMAAILVAAACGRTPAPGPPAAPTTSPPESPAPPPSFRPEPRSPDPAPPAEPLPPLAATLEPRWVHTAAEGHGIGTPAVDAAGRVFWLEHDTYGALELVSRERGGALRFRVAVAPAGDKATFRWEDLIVAEPYVVVSYALPGRCITDHVVEARSLADGALSWRRDLGDDLGAVSFCEVQAGGLASTGDAVASFTHRCSRSPDGRSGSCVGALEALSLEDGRTSWSVPAETDVHDPDGQPIVDEDGNVYAYLFERDTFEPSYLLSVTPDGTVRYRRYLPTIRSIHGVASGGIVALERGGAGAVLDARTGFVALSVHAYLDGAAIAGTFVFGESLDQLFRMRLGAEEEDWSYALARPPSPTHAGAMHLGPLLTDAGTLLVVDQQSEVGAPPYPAILREVDVAGTLRAEATLAGVESARGVTLGDGMLYVAGASTTWPVPRELRAYEVPGRRPAPDGWNSADGSMARDRRAR